VKQAFIYNVLLEVKQKSLHTVWGHNAYEVYERESCYIVELVCHSVVGLATGPQPLPKQVLRSAWCSASLMFVDACIIVHFIKKNPTRYNNVSKFYCSIFIWSSKRFGRHAAHHQEPKTALAASSFSYMEGCWTCS